jgi:hypothetical protein
MMIIAHPGSTAVVQDVPPSGHGFKREVRRAFFGPGLRVGWSIILGG